MGIEATRIELTAVDSSLPVFRTHREEIDRLTDAYSRSGAAAAAAAADRERYADSQSSTTRLIQQVSAGQRAIAETEQAANKASQAIEKIGAAGSQSFKQYSDAAGVADRQTKALAESTALFKRLIGGAAAAFGGAELISQTDQYTKYTAQLKLASSSAVEYGNSLLEVRRIAKDAQADLSATGVLYARISNGTKELGVSQKRVAEITESVNLALKVSGATTTESASAMLQLSQSFASGTLRGEEFNAVNEAAPRLMKALADGIGVPVGALKDLASNGKITSEVMANALPKALGDLRREAESVQTISGSFTVLKNNVLEFIGTQAEANGTVSLISSGVSLLANNIGLVAAAATGLGAAKLIETVAGIGAAVVQGTVNTIAYADAQSVQRAAAIAAAQGEVAATVATAEHLATTQTAIVVSREAAIAQLANANSTIIASEAQIAASRSAGALSFALANLASGEATLTVASQARSAAMAELAILGQQQVRVSAEIAAANAAQTASQMALNGAMTAGGVAGGVASKAIGMLGGPIGAVATILGIGVTAWMAWSSASKESEKVATESVKKSTSDIISDLDKQISKLKERNALAGSLGNIAKQETESVKELARLRAEMTDLQDGTGQYKNTTQSIRTELLYSVGRQYGELYGKILAVNEEQKKFDSTGKAATDLVEVRERLLGVNKQYLDDLTKLSTAREKGAVDEREYIDLVKQLATETYNKSKAGKDAAKSTKEASAEEERLASLLLKTSGLTRTFSDDWDMLSTAYKAGKVSLDNLIEAQARLLDQQPAIKKANEEIVKAQKIREKTQAEVTAQIDKWLIAAEAEAELLDENYKLYGKSSEARKIASAQIKIETELQKFLAEQKKKEHGISSEQIDDLTQQAEKRKQNIAAIMGENQALAGAEQLRQLNQRFDAENIYDAKTRARALLEIDADVWRERIKLAGEGTDAQKKLQGEFNTWYANQSIKPLIDEQHKFWDSVDRTAHDTFVSVLNNGKNTFDRLTDTLKSGLLDALYQMATTNWKISITSSVTDNVAANAAASAVGGNGGGIGSLFGNVTSLLSAGKTMWSGFSSAFAATSGMDTGLAAMYRSGATAGNLTTSAQAGGAAGNYAMAGGIAAAVLAAMSYNNSLYQKGWNIKNGTEANAAGTLVNGGLPTNGFLSLFSSVGAVKLSDSIMQKLGMSSQLASLLSGSSVIASLFGNKDPEITRRYITGSFSGAGFNGQNNADWFSKGGVFSSDKTGTQSAALDSGFAKALSKQYEAITTATTIFATSLGVNVDYIKSRTQSISVDLGKDDEENKANIAKLFSDITNDISKEVLQLADNAGLALSSLAKEDEKASDTLARLSFNFTGVNGVLKDLGYTSLELTQAGIKASDTLINLYGSLDTMKAVSASYYETYYTDTEKAAVVTKNLTEEFKGIGYTLPESLQQLRSWIEAAKDLGNEAGNKTYVALMQLTGAFAGLQDIKKPDDDKLKQRSEIMLQIMEAQGLGQQALNIKRQTELILMDDETRALSEKLDVALKEKDARDLATRQANLMVQVLELEGKTTESAALKHKLEMAATEEGLRPLTERIYQLGLENTAMEVAKQHRALDIELMRALGNEEAALAAERADSLIGLDDYSKGVKQQIYAANAAQTAIAKAQASAKAEMERIQQEQDKALQQYESSKSAAESKLSAAVSRRTSELNSLTSAMESFGKQAMSAKEAMIYGPNSTLGTEAKYLRSKDSLGSLEARAMQQDSGAISELQQFIELSRAYNASNGVFVGEFDRVQAILDRASKTAMSQADYARAQLGALNDSVRGLIDVKDATTDSAQEVVNAIKELTELTRGNLIAKNAASGASSITTKTGPTPDQLYGGLPGEGTLQQARMTALQQEAANTAKVTAYMEQALQADLRAAQNGGVTNQYYMDLNDKYYTQAAFERFARELGIFANPDLPTASRLPQRYARGGVFTNGVVSQPTNFEYGQMGEENPEAIMPLVQGAKGLGIRNYGGSGKDKETLDLIKRQVAEAELNNDLLEKQNELLEKLLKSTDEGAGTEDIRKMSQTLITTVAKLIRTPA